MAPPENHATGRRYLERGRPVVLLARWVPGGGPHNALVQREDGTVVVRPFRGLRRCSGDAATRDSHERT